MSIRSPYFLVCLFGNDLSAYITMTVDGNEVPNGVSQILHSIYADDKVYDLKGRRVVTPGKGIYIMNGRKIYK